MADDTPRDRLREFEASYEGTPPWDIGRPQPPFAALAEAGRLDGRLLDVGCGTGEHVLMAAAAGLDATGIDIAPTAIRLAEAKAAERGLAATFVVGDASRATFAEPFDTVLDCGLFHTFADADRATFVRHLEATVRPGGRFFMLCFSDSEPGDWGPRRISTDEIEAAFRDGWTVDAIEPAELHVTIRDDPVRALLATITRNA
jgi:cyclopropane fatty-acyl-phospholipid synthase-like methyltransferase